MICACREWQVNACNCGLGIYLGTSVQLCGVSFVSVVEPQSLIYV
jgi:hypothetical protein